MKPEKLKCSLQEKKVKNAAELYEKELKLSELEHSMKKVQRRGYAMLENIYTNKYVAWHQDIPINVNKKMELEGFRA